MQMHAPTHPQQPGPGERLPVYFLSHGGGPWPYMSGSFRDMFVLLERSLNDIPRQLPVAPRAVLVITAHWEEKNFTVSSAAQPGMLYDYHGFAEPLYSVRYPAPGAPALARQIAALLQGAGWQVDLNDQRGYDHGTFSLLKPIFPSAQKPVVQLSMRDTLDPAEHFAMGQALAPLRDEGVLILGSGQSFHNMHLRGKQARLASEAFDSWLRHAVLDKSASQRRDALIRWEEAPVARIAHPRADHLIPLMVAAGAAGNDHATCIFGDHILDIASSAFRFGGTDEAGRFDILRLHEKNGDAGA